MPLGAAKAAFLGAAGTVGGGAYEYIAGHTFTGSEDSFTFTSIPQTYKSLRIMAYIIEANPQVTPDIQINGVTTSDYQENAVYSSSSSYSSILYANLSYISTATAPQINKDFLNEINLDGYENTSICSPIQHQWGIRDDPCNSVQGNLQNLATDAITSLKYYSSAGTNFASGSIISMFGMVDA